MSSSKERKQAERKPKSKLHKTLDWIVTGVFVALFGVVAAFQIASFVTKKDNFGVPCVAGNQTLIVLTDSMEKYDENGKQIGYEVGSAVIVKKVDPSTLKPGDDITFYYSPWSSYMSNPIVTHQILNIEINEEVPVGEGHYTFICHGINTDSDNCNTTGGSRDCTNQTQRVTEQYVLGKVTKNSKAVGVVYKFATSTWGLISLLLIPALYLIISSVIDLVKALKEPEEASATITASEGENSNDVLSGLSEEEKERLKREMLEQMLGGKQDDK